MIISRTPFRISFFGGGTDYPAWYRKHGGEVLATTINKYCYITCRFLPPFFEHRIRFVWSKMENCQYADEISHPAARAILRYLNIDRGLEIHHDGDLPARSGLGSSSSFTVGLLHALNALKGTMSGKQQLAKNSIHIEQEVLKETVGSQDQISAAYGGFNHIAFLKNDEFIVRPITLSQNYIDDLNSHFMLFYTGIKRTASDVASSYVKDIESKSPQLQSMQYLLKESISVLNSGRDICDLGRLLDEAWKRKRSLSSIVSNHNVDEIYDQAISAGAIGGKLTGAGGGGFLLLFAPPANQKKIRERLNKLIYVPFRFEFSGSQIIFYDQEEDYSNIEKERFKQHICAFKEL